jgi:hypothetical protein
MAAPTMSGGRDGLRHLGAPATGLARRPRIAVAVGGVAGIFRRPRQETASGRAGKGRIRARLITHAKNTCGSTQHGRGCGASAITSARRSAPGRIVTLDIGETTLREFDDRGDTP